MAAQGTGSMGLSASWHFPPALDLPPLCITCAHVCLVFTRFVCASLLYLYPSFLLLPLPCGSASLPLPLPPLSPLQFRSHQGPAWPSQPGSPGFSLPLQLQLICPCPRHFSPSTSLLPRPTLLPSHWLIQTPWASLFQVLTHFPNNSRKSAAWLYPLNS